MPKANRSASAQASRKGKDARKLRRSPRLFAIQSGVRGRRSQLEDVTTPEVGCQQQGWDRAEEPKLDQVPGPSRGSGPRQRRIQGEQIKYVETMRMAACQFRGLGWHVEKEQFRLGEEANPRHSWGATGHGVVGHGGGHYCVCQFCSICTN